MKIVTDIKAFIEVEVQVQDNKYQYKTSCQKERPFSQVQDLVTISCTGLQCSVMPA